MKFYEVRRVNKKICFFDANDISINYFMQYKNEFGFAVIDKRIYLPAKKMEDIINSEDEFSGVIYNNFGRLSEVIETHLNGFYVTAEQLQVFEEKLKMDTPQGVKVKVLKVKLNEFYSKEWIIPLDKLVTQNLVGIEETLVPNPIRD